MSEPTNIIPFPAAKRVGHAGRVARLLAEARTVKHADAILTRACETFVRQMSRAGFTVGTMERERADFLKAIASECYRIGAPWTPCLPETSRHSDGAA